MATRKKTPASVMGGGSVLSSVSGPSSTGTPDSLGGDADAREFVRLRYRHCKPLLTIGAGADLPAALQDGSLAEFKQTLAAHRDFRRETDAAPL